MKYLRVSVNTTTEFSDIVASKLFDCGTSGVSVKDSNDILESLKSPLNWDYADDTLLNAGNDPRVVVTGFFDEAADLNSITEAIGSLGNDSFFDTGSLEVTAGVEDSAAWENVWKQYFKPIPMGKVTIVPKWLHFDGKNSIPVYIDPGLAFGTGNHETTAMCAELLDGFDLSGRTVADIGCGSGILGICALKLGAKICTFIDIDENAVKASKDNAAYNGVTDRARFILGDLSVAKQEPADLILANLTADLLVRLKPEASAMLKKGGAVIMSGILDSYADAVSAAYREEFTHVKTLSRNNWKAMVFIKK